jgi:hypothetical protein
MATGAPKCCIMEAKARAKWALVRFGLVREYLGDTQVCRARSAASVFCVCRKCKDVPSVRTAQEAANTRGGLGRGSSNFVPSRVCLRGEISGRTLNGP